MKRSFFLLSLLFSAIGFFSCTRCVTCDQCPQTVSLSSEEICENDFASKEAFDREIQIVEGYGCTCVDQ